MLKSRQQPKRRQPAPHPGPKLRTHFRYKRTQRKGLLAALGQAATVPRDTQKDSREQHSVYGLWHSHISALIIEERPDLDAELLAHVLLGSLQNGPIVHLLGQGETRQLAIALRLLVTGMLKE